MQAEKTVKKIKTIDYTADIKLLFELHHEKISKKIMHLLPLLLIQSPDVKKEMVEFYVNTEFNFCFPSSKRTFSSDYKKTVKNLLKKAILDGFDEAEAEYLLWGFILQTIPTSEIKTLTRSVLSGTFIPDKGIPDIHQLLETLETLQEKFSGIQHYKTMARLDLLDSSIVGPMSAGANASLLVMPLSLLILLAAILLEIYLFTTALYSESKEKNALAIPIFVSAIIFDVLLMGALQRCLLTVKHARIKDKANVKNNTNHALAGKLPDLVTVEIENEIRYMLPLFVPKSSIIEALPLDFVSQAVKEEAVAEKKVKKKTRSPTSSFMGFFQGNSADQGVSSTSPKDIIKLDEVVYRRLYNKNKIPTKQFVGYTQNSLWELTQHENYDAFKALLDAPSFVPPKGHNGFVEMKKETSSGVHFKAKVVRSDLRLLFSPPKEAKVNGEKIHLYQLSGAKTHNQFGRR